MYKITFYVPEKDCDNVCNALFDLGAGKIGNYDRCCFLVKGVGQFRPLVGSNPTIGSLNQVHRENEYRVEMICIDELIKEVCAELKEVHPYEEVAFDVVEVLTF